MAKLGGKARPTPQPRTESPGAGLPPGTFPHGTGGRTRARSICVTCPRSPYRAEPTSVLFLAIYCGSAVRSVLENGHLPIGKVFIRPWTRVARLLSRSTLETACGQLHASPPRQVSTFACWTEASPFISTHFFLKLKFYLEFVLERPEFHEDALVTRGLSVRLQPFATGPPPRQPAASWASPRGRGRPPPSCTYRPEFEVAFRWRQISNSSRA